MPFLRPFQYIRGAERWHDWLVFPPWRPRAHSLFFLSVSTPSAAGLHGQLVIMLNSPMEALCHSIPIVLWDRDYVCYPLTPFSKRNYICTSSVNQETSSGILCMASLLIKQHNRKQITTSLGLEQNYLLHLSQSFPGRGSGILSSCP